MKSNNISSKKQSKLINPSDTELNTLLEVIYAGGIPHIEIKKTLQTNLMNFYQWLDANPKYKEKFNKAQEIGIKTLVEKLLAVYQVENPDLSNEQLLFLKEKQSYLRWLAPRISSLFVERTEQKIKSDSVVRVSWESDSLIDADATIVDSDDKQNPLLQDNLK
tara:strand:- start:1464 stop:1952 length:489 start_codon:yes stop_codon:yes gene_type:complete